MIQIQGLAKRYGRSEALHDITLQVPPSSVFALVGPNGAGKSTVLKIVMNLVSPSAGKVEVLGVDSRRLGAEQLSQIGYVSENQSLPDWMRVGHFLDYAKAHYPSWSDEVAAKLVREYNLPLGTRLRHLSRGMRVKALLAASLAYNPRLIVLDEPFGGLDALVREQLIGSLIDQTPEATVFLASHDLSEIESFATHVGYLNEGHLEFVEEMAALAARFREIEITLDEPSGMPSDLPPDWLHPEQSGVAVRFIDTSFEAGRSREEVARRFTGIRDIAVRPMSFRSIFVALAKSRRGRCA